MTKQVFQPSVNEDLNRPHKVTLTEGQISTILYVLEGYIQGSDDYHFDDNFKKDMDNIIYGRIIKAFRNNFCHVINLLR